MTCEDNPQQLCNCSTAVDASGVNWCSKQFSWDAAGHNMPGIITSLAQTTTQLTLDNTIHEQVHDVEEHLKHTVVVFSNFVMLL